jgi:hypothetical protein
MHREFALHGVEHLSRILLKRKTDEAVVLLWFLSRELWGSEGQVAGCTAHPAELHVLHSLLQELIPPLLWTGGVDADEICRAARENYQRGTREAPRWCSLSGWLDS